MIPGGLRSAAAALRYWEDRQQIVANNLANANTHGFKAERVFARLVGENLVAADTATDLTQGNLTSTGRPLDLALEGPGFFVIETADGERLIRGGAMHVDDAGRIVTARGEPLLGDDGPIVIPPGAVEIAADGEVRVEGRSVGRLRVEDVPPDATLAHAGAGRFLTDAARVPVDPDARQVRQGRLEESNVNPIESLVEMITVQRSFAAVQRSVRVIDEVMGTIANRIGKIG